MRIKRLSLYPFRVPLRHPISFATGVLTSAEHVLVTVETEDGVKGHAEAIPRPMVYGETTASVIASIRSLIGPPLVGTSIVATEAHAFQLRNVVANNTARAAVETAIFDAWGKTVGQSCAQLLGGFADSVGCTLLLGWGEPETVLEQAVAAREAYGVESFKMKAGLDVRADVRILQALRDGLGPDSLIYADANHGYSSADARTFLDAAIDLGLAWFEEPMPADGVTARRDFARHSPIPIVGDESCTDLGRVAAEVESGRSSMVSIKTARTSLRESLRIRHYCEATGTDVVIGSQGESTVGTLVAAAFAASGASTSRYPAEVMYFLDLEANPTTTDPVIADGRMQIPDGPGFGIEIDQDRFYSMTHGAAVHVR